MYLHSFVSGFHIRLGIGGGWSIIVRCCSLSVSCVNSAVGVGGWVADFKLANWSGSCWICSSIQPRDGECQFPHCFHQMNHYLIQA